ncbi:MAG: RNA-guided endonuclease InsQ/TnpB family protein [Candidatus Heimdallarchaeaceae archaeon]
MREIVKYSNKNLSTDETLKKTLIINCLPLTKRKQDIFSSFFNEYLRVLNLTLKRLPEAKSSTELHHLTYSIIRKSSFLPSDVIQEARKDVWAKRKTIKNGFKKCSIRLNPRWFKFFKTERGTPCFRVTYSPHKSFVIPVRKDGAYKRFKEHLESEWKTKSITILNSKIAICIEKEFPKPANDRRYIIGVDIGSSIFAAVTILDTWTGKTVKQLYFGRDVAEKQRKYEKRRAILQSHANKGSEKAKKYLRKLKHKQRNFVRTRSGQITKEIVNLAMEYNEFIAIEKLSIRGRKGKINKNGRKKINRIPFGQFREFLKSNCEQFNIPLQEVDAYHTSKWCPKCGALNKGHSSNYALYKCRCGFVANSDRKASKAIAIKSALVRELQGLTKPFLFSQFTRAGVPVNGLFRPDDGVLIGAVHLTQPLMESLPTCR